MYFPAKINILQIHCHRSPLININNIISPDITVRIPATKKQHDIIPINELNPIFADKYRTQETKHVLSLYQTPIA